MTEIQNNYSRHPRVSGALVTQSSSNKVQTQRKAYRVKNGQVSDGGTQERVCLNLDNYGVQWQHRAVPCLAQKGILIYRRTTACGVFGLTCDKHKGGRERRGAEPQILVLSLVQ